MDPELWAEIRRLHLRERWTKKKIARELRVDPKTVRSALRMSRYLARRKPEPRPSKLDPFRDTIRRLVLPPSKLTSVRVFDEIRRLGYTGRVSILNDFIREIRPEPDKEAFLKISFPPGDAAQVDWTSCGRILVGGRSRRLSAFLLVLCYSRLLYVEFTLAEDLSVFMSCHENAFAVIGGIPRRILYDNLRAVVLAHVGADVRFNPRFLDFSLHHGFKPVACAPYRPNEKGRVENAGKYLKGNFLPGRTLAEPETLNPQVRTWLDEVANVREHRTTHRRPIDLFEEERKLLGPLSEKGYDTRIVKTVRANHLCRVQFDGNAYSVPPACAGRDLTLKASATEMALYFGSEEVARHVRSKGRGEDIVDPGHVRALLERKHRGERGATVQRFLALGPEAEPYLKGLVRTEVSLYRHLRRIVSLCDRYGRGDVLAAMTHAREYGAFGADYVERIVQEERRRRRVGPPPGPIVLTTAPDLTSITLSEIDLEAYDRAFDPEKKEEGIPDDESPPAGPGGASPGVPDEARPDADPRDLPRGAGPDGEGGSEFPGDPLPAP